MNHICLMGAAESSQCANYDIFQKDGSYYSPFAWELHHAKSKVDGTVVSIFKTGVKREVSSNAYECADGLIGVV